LYQVFWQDADNDKRFAQFFVGGSLADDNPSFSRWDIFGSVQAFGPLASRPNDRMGLAGWYNALADDFDDTVSSIPGLSLRDTWGFEVYYNIEINPWLHLTPDLQLVMNENNGDDLAVIPGIRAVIDF
jgi:porin